MYAAEVVFSFLLVDIEYLVLCGLEAWSNGDNMGFPIQTPDNPAGVEKHLGILDDPPPENRLNPSCAGARKYMHGMVSPSSEVVAE